MSGVDARSSSFGRVAIAALLAFGLLGGDARADRVVTTDGRILTPKKARAEGAGYRLEFENGTIVLADLERMAEGVYS